MILIVECPDEMLVHVPEWMTRPEAARVGLEEHPTLSLQSLAALRESIDAFLVALSASTQGECDEPDSKRATGGPVCPGRALAGTDPKGTVAVAGGADHRRDDNDTSNHVEDGRRR
ncbi:MAG: hypothetical protein OXL68_14915 [Paracoccaceae bacterium]|nr:hypothetical protein [Paracoccaceae bacterium]